MSREKEWYNSWRSLPSPCAKCLVGSFQIHSNLLPNSKWSNNLSLSWEVSENDCESLNHTSFIPWNPYQLTLFLVSSAGVPSFYSHQLTLLSWTFLFHILSNSTDIIYSSPQLLARFTELVTDPLSSDDSFHLIPSLDSLSQVALLLFSLFLTTNFRWLSPLSLSWLKFVDANDERWGRRYARTMNEAKMRGSEMQMKEGRDW